MTTIAGVFYMDDEGTMQYDMAKPHATPDEVIAAFFLAHPEAQEDVQRWMDMEITARSAIRDH